MAKLGIALVILLLLPLAGCVADEPAVRLPAVTEITAQYDVLGQDGQTRRATVSGFDLAPSHDGITGAIMHPTLAVTTPLASCDSEGCLYLKHRIELHHQNTAVLHGFTLACSPVGKASCAIGSGETTTTLIPDARGAPGMLGAGPFAGHALRAGDVVTFPLWDVVAPATVTWTLTEAPDHEGHHCLWATADPVATPKTPSIAAPWSGRLRLCDGFALPVEIDHVLDWSLKEYAAVPGVLAAAEATDAPSGRPVCKAVVPEDTPRTASAATYAEWAREHDDELGGWLRSHPDGVVAPGFGRLVQEPRTGTTYGYEVPVAVLAFDPASSVGALYAGGVHWNWDPIFGFTHTNDPSNRHSRDHPILGAVAPTCSGRTINIAALAEQMIERTEYDEIRQYEIVLAPDTYRTGTYRALHPESLLGITDPADLRPQGSPWKAFMRYIPAGDGSIFTYSYVIADPSTGWLRLLDVNPQSWPPG